MYLWDQIMGVNFQQKKTTTKKPKKALVQYGAYRSRTVYSMNIIFVFQETKIPTSSHGVMSRASWVTYELVIDWQISLRAESKLALTEQDEPNQTRHCRRVQQQQLETLLGFDESRRIRSWGCFFLVVVMPLQFTPRLLYIHSWSENGELLSI